MSEVAHFFAMGGYGAYVWSAYGLVLVVLAANAAGPWLRQRRLLRRLSLRAAPEEGPVERRGGAAD